ncbi:MAG: tol-pal system YbgF family protein [Saprospiraceae bacterium]
MNFNNLKIEERIDRYLSQMMTKEEHIAFEKEVEQSSTLQEQVELNKLIKIYQEHPEIPDVRKLIQSTMNKKQVEIPAEYKEKTITKAFSTPKNSFTIQRIIPIIALAASIVLAIIFVPYFTSSGDVFTDNFTPKPNLTVSFEEEDLQLISKSEKTNLNKQIQIIEKALENQEYDKALELLNVLFKDNWLKDELFIYHANALLGKGKIKQAIVEYEQLLDNETIFKFMTKWYLALAHIKNDDTSKAKEILQELSITDNDYQRDAKRLLKKL